MKTDWPRISLITPSYNQAEFIGRTIQSVLGQKYPNLDYLVMDGGSADGTVEILKRYQGRLRWVSAKDHGQSDAINQGIKRSTGEIVAYLNSDDVLARGALWRVALAFLRHPEKRWLAGDCQIINAHGAPRDSLISAYKRFFRFWLSFPVFGRLVLGVLNPIAQPATFWRRSVIAEIGVLDEDLCYTMDYDFWLRLCRLGPPLVVTDILAGFRLHGLSKGNTGFHQQFGEQLNVAKKSGYPSWILKFQTIHNQLIELIYSRRK